MEITRKDFNRIIEITQKNYYDVTIDDYEFLENIKKKYDPKNEGTHSVFEFRMSGEPHLWQNDIDLREVSYDDVDGLVLLKMDGTNNKTKKREQIQLHFSKYLFSSLVEGINRVIPKVKLE